MDDVDVEFEFVEEEVGAVRAAIEEEGVPFEEVEEANLLTGLEIVAVVLAINALVNIALKIARALKAGVVIDARGSLVHIEKRSELPSGTILVLDREGSQHTLHEPSELKLAELIQGIIGA